MGRKFNFNPGPTALPEPVLEKARDAVLDYNGIGLGVMEMSHRSPQFEEILANAQNSLRRLMEIPDDYHILFLQGGARTQFAMIPMNFLHTSGAYINTGTWANKAVDEAQLVGTTKVIASSKDAKFSHIPSNDSFSLNGDESYLHITSNNTIYGTQWHQWPETGDVPLIVDMSSDIASRKVDIKQFDMIYAGAQKNIGPAGVTLAIIKDEFAKKAKSDHLSHMFRYNTFIKANSLYNTPPVWSIFVVSLVLAWIEDIGGIEGISKINQQKADLLYHLFDSNPDFFTGTAKKESRSLMNITVRLPNEELEKELISNASNDGFIGIKGHRSVGGIRISNYNAVTLEAIEKLTAYLKDFAAKHS